MSKALKIIGAIVVSFVLLGTLALFVVYFMFFSSKIETVTNIKTVTQAQSALSGLLGVQGDAISNLLGGNAASDDSIAYDLYTVDYKSDYKLDEFLAEGAEDLEAFNLFLGRKLLFSTMVSTDAYGLTGSAFSARTPSGNQITAMNSDSYITDVGLVWTHPKGGYASVSLVDLSALGYSSQGFLQKMQALLTPYFPQVGMNEKGLTVSLLRVFGASCAREGEVSLPPTVMARTLLDKAATLDEAAALLERYGIAALYEDGDFQLYLTDRDGGTLLAQYDGGKMYLTRGEAAVTNFFLASEASQLEENRIGLERYQRLTEGLAQPLERAQAMDVLKSARSSRYEGKQTPGMQTLYSVVFDQTAGEVDLCFGENFDETFRFRADQREQITQ